MNLFSVFSGIGGFDLAFQWAGFQVVGQVENDNFCQRVLHKHWPYVPKWGDIRRVSGGEVRARLRLRHDHPIAIDVLAGGFPCQSFSKAGKRKGTADDRYLWPEMLRLVRELRPRIVFFENVTGLISLALGEILADLEGEAYTVFPPLVVPACAVSASHIRDRVWVVACANELRRHESEGIGQPGHDQERHNASRQRGGRTEFHAAVAGGEAVAYADDDRSQAGLFGRGIWDAPAGSGQELVNAQCTGFQGQNWQDIRTNQSARSSRWLPQSSMGRADDGLSGGMDGTWGFPAYPGQAQKTWEAPRTVPHRVAHHSARLQAIGNAVVPQVVYPFACAIGELLGELNTWEK